MRINLSFNASSFVSNFTKYADLIQVRNLVLQSVPKYLNLSTNSVYNMSYRFMSNGIAFIAGNNNVVWENPPHLNYNNVSECGLVQGQSSIYGSAYQTVCYISTNLKDSFVELQGQLCSISYNYTIERILRNKGKVVGTLNETVEGCRNLTLSQIMNIITGEGDCVVTELTTPINEVTTQLFVSEAVTNAKELFPLSGSSTDEWITQSPGCFSADDGMDLSTIISGVAVGVLCVLVGLGVGYILGRSCKRAPSSKLENGEDSSQGIKSFNTADNSNRVTLLQK